MTISVGICILVGCVLSGAMVVGFTSAIYRLFVRHRRPSASFDRYLSVISSGADLLVLADDEVIREESIHPSYWRLSDKFEEIRI